MAKKKAFRRCRDGILIVASAQSQEQESEAERERVHGDYKRFYKIATKIQFNFQFNGL